MVDNVIAAHPSSNSTASRYCVVCIAEQVVIDKTKIESAPYCSQWRDGSSQLVIVDFQPSEPRHTIHTGRNSPNELVSVQIKSRHLPQTHNLSRDASNQLIGFKVESRHGCQDKKLTWNRPRNFTNMVAWTNIVSTVSS